MLTAAVLLVLCLAAYKWGGRITTLREWIGEQGAWAPAVFVAVYVIAALIMIPASILTAMGSALFGSIYGTLIVTLSATLSAAVAFLISRHLARDAFERWLEGHETFRRLDHLTETHGATVVALARLVPVFPFDILNYAFGLTRVSFGTYIIWTALCILPATLLYVVGVDAAVQAMAERSVPWGRLAVFVLTCVILYILVQRARKRIGA